MYDDTTMNEREARPIRGHLGGNIECANTRVLLTDCTLPLVLT